MDLIASKQKNKCKDKIQNKAFYLQQNFSCCHQCEIKYDKLCLGIYRKQKFVRILSFKPITIHYVTLDWGMTNRKIAKLCLLKKII